MYYLLQESEDNGKTWNDVSDPSTNKSEAIQLKKYFERQYRSFKYRIVKLSYESTNN